MHSLTRVLACGAAIAVGFASSDALALGKAGLWNITTTMNFGAGMPQMPQMTAEQMEQMRRMGVQMPAMMLGKPVTTQRCVSPQDAASSRPPAVTRDGDKCEMQNFQTRGRTITADMVCTGDMNGKGDLQFTYDSDEHYTGLVDFKGTAQGHSANMKITFDGKWLRANCGQ